MYDPFSPSRAVCGPPTLDAILAFIRDARFNDGIRCPRCLATRIQRWGSFSERQRYRCLGCRRTFSDLTGTPAAYVKKLALWPEYIDCLRRGSSLRTSAATVGIHLTTAFRWRHALLGELRASFVDQLAGWIEISWFWLRYSEKRPGSGKGWVRGQYELGSVVVLACDRRGGVVAVPDEVTGWRGLYTHTLERTLGPRLPSRPTLLMDQGRLCAAGILAHRLSAAFHSARLPLRQTRRSLVHVATVSDYRRRLRSWLERFRGVATRYLPNYLAWHHAVEGDRRRGFESLALRWML